MNPRFVLRDPRFALRNRVLKELHDGLWHTTSSDRFKSILTTCAILPNPNIPDSERWKTSMGAHYYPYVRTIGGVSLFDFDSFDAESYNHQYPFSTWDEFVPWRESWGSSVWIEIDRVRLADGFISTLDLLARWKTDEARSHTIMPKIEAAYLGSIPRVVFIRAFLASPNGIDWIDQGFSLA